MRQEASAGKMDGSTPLVHPEQDGSTTSIMPIAVIGMAFRGPGDATSPQKLWDMCCEGRNAWTEFPRDRINMEGFWHPEATRPGCFNSRGGHFLRDDVSLFDAPFFSISPNEARAMDPQHRLFLESSYEALENAGIPLQKAAGTKTAVFVGFCGSDYLALLCRDPETAPRYQTTGSAFSILANRVSYAFDLKGPSCTLDTACSSSLTAVHLACQSLRLGEAVQAIVGGVGVLLSPDIWSGMSSLGLFSEEGRCFSFDTRASGYGRGEGVATVVLKPLDDAIRDNDNIHSVIRHVGVNHDGRTRGIVRPNLQAQTKLIQRVYREAGLDASETHYIEAHGPGTAIGDPIEAGAIANAIAARKSSELLVGSVKSNVGHMEGASGLAGLIKTSMVLKKGKVPPNANFQSPNKRIPLHDWNLQIATSLQDWPFECIRRASVSSFGFGGANSHIILEGPPQDQRPLDHNPSSETPEPGSNADTDPVPKLIVLSAADPSSAKSQAANLVNYIQSQNAEVQREGAFDSLVHTLASRRSHLEWRLAVPADSTEALLEALNISNLEAKKIPVKQARLGFVFSGQGSQWQAMGQELMRDFSVFATVIEESDIYLQELGATWSLKDVLRGVSCPDINDPQISQPVTTSVQIGIASLLKSWGIVPAKVTGHSSGEFAAAHAVGALSLQSCLSVAYHRGRLASSLSNSENGLRGAMLAVGASYAKVNTMLKKVQHGKASVACINSPSLVVASGDETATQALGTIAESEKLFVQKLRVDVAYHSHHMHAIADEYLDCLEGIEASPGTQVAFYSSLQGQALDQKSLSSMYWVEHLFSPVKFCAAVKEMCFDFQTEEENASIIIVEIGPHSSLKAAINDIVKSNGWAHNVTYLSSLLIGEDTTRQMLKLASNLFAKGQPINLEAVNFPHGSRGLKPLGDLPPYAWKHDKSYWHESRLSRNYRLRPFPRNDILGSLVDDYNDIEPRWRNVLRAKDLPWLLDHKVQGTAVFPFAGFITMALEALRQWTLMASVGLDTSSRYELREVLISRPLVIPRTSDVETSIALRALADGTRSSATLWNEFSVSSWTQDQGWTEHCKGLIRLVNKSLGLNRVDEECILHEHEAIQKATRELEQACKTSVNCKEFYQMAAKAGLEYGPTFQNLCEARSAPSLCVGHVRKPNIAEVMPRGYQTNLIIHPALLDAFFHPLLVLLADELLKPDNPYAPTFIKSFSISSSNYETPSEEYICYGTGHLKVSGQLSGASLRVFDGSHTDQTPYLELEDMIGAAIPRDDSIHQILKRDLCYKLAWKPLKEVIDSSEKTESPHDENLIDAADGIDPKAVTFTYSCHPGDELTRSIKKNFKDNDEKPFFVALEDVVPQRINYVFLDHAEPVLQKLDAQRLLLLQALFAKAAGILWVTCGARTQAGSPASSMSAGWTRCLRCEMVNVKLATLDLDTRTMKEYEKAAGMLCKVLRDVVLKETSSATDMEYAEVDGVLTVPRLLPDRDKDQYIVRQVYGQAQVLQPYKQEDRNLQVRISRPGLLQSITFIDSSITSKPLSNNEVEIEVHTTGMNFKDIMIGLGQIQHQELGFECSGVITKLGIEARRAGFNSGDRVCAISNACYANFTRASCDGMIKLPDDMDFAIAASIPIVYCTAYHALFDIGRLTNGEAVLIHSAAGGVGQAAIMLAQHAGAEVFATVGSEEKKCLLIEKYGIPRDRIFSSRATTFEQGILKATQRKGVALVLSSVSAEMRRLSLNVLAPLGRFVEIGKRDLELNARLEMNNFTKALTFAAVDLEILSREFPPIIKRTLKAVFDALKDYPETIKPVTPITTFPTSKLESAMRILQGGKHMGKIVIEAKDDDYVLANPPPEPLTLRSDVSYLITGGTGSIGRSLARWMAAEGAKFIILASRSGQAADGIQMLVQDMESIGTRVIMQQCDIGSESDVEQLMRCPIRHGLPPIAGVVHGAMVLQDVLFEKSTIEDYCKVIEPRVQGAWNLHNVLLATETELDFFVILSSTSGILGNPGQSAYAASNSFLDAFAQFRRNLQLPASSIDVGLVSEVGYVSRNLPKNISLDALVHDPIKERDLHALVKAAIADKNPECDYTQTITGVKLDPTKPLPFWAMDPKMSEILPTMDKTANGGGGDDQAASVRKALKRCTSNDEAVRIVCDAIVNKLSAISLTPKEHFDVHKNMNAYGMDSLVAVEVRNWMASELGVNLSLFEFMKITNVLQLSKVVVGKSRFLVHLLDV